MEGTVSVSTSGNSWEVVPTNPLAGILLAILFIYLFFRHFMFALMFMDIILGWLKQFFWFPGKGKRKKTLVHWAIALGLFLGYLSVAGKMGYLEFVPQ